MSVMGPDGKILQPGVGWWSPYGNTDKRLYHLSEDDLDGKILQPRVPNNFMLCKGYEDGTTKRVSFSSTVDGALVGMSDNIEGKVFFLHEPVSYEGLNVVENASLVKKKLVPDAHLTGENWVVSPVKLRRVGKIQVTEAKDPPLRYQYGSENQYDADTYQWDYIIKEQDKKWIEVISEGR